MTSHETALFRIGRFAFPIAASAMVACGPAVETSTTETGVALAPFSSANNEQVSRAIKNALDDPEWAEAISVQWLSASEPSDLETQALEDSEYETNRSLINAWIEKTAFRIRYLCELVTVLNPPSSDTGLEDYPSILVAHTNSETLPYDSVLSSLSVSQSANELTAQDSEPLIHLQQELLVQARLYEAIDQPDQAANSLVVSYVLAESYALNNGPLREAMEAIQRYSTTQLARLRQAHPNQVVPSEQSEFIFNIVTELYTPEFIEGHLAYAEQLHSLEGWQNYLLNDDFVERRAVVLSQAAGIPIDQARHTIINQAQAVISETQLAPTLRVPTIISNAQITPGFNQSFEVTHVGVELGDGYQETIDMSHVAPGQRRLNQVFSNPEVSLEASGAIEVSRLAVFEYQGHHFVGLVFENANETEARVAPLDFSGIVLGKSISSRSQLGLDNCICLTRAEDNYGSVEGDPVINEVRFVSSGAELSIGPAQLSPRQTLEALFEFDQSPFGPRMLDIYFNPQEQTRFTHLIFIEPETQTWIQQGQQITPYQIGSEPVFTDSQMILPYLPDGLVHPGSILEIGADEGSPAFYQIGETQEGEPILIMLNNNLGVHVVSFHLPISVMNNTMSASLGLTTLLRLPIGPYKAKISMSSGHSWKIVSEIGWRSAGVELFANGPFDLLETLVDPDPGARTRMLSFATGVALAQRSLEQIQASRSSALGPYTLAALQRTRQVGAYKPPIGTMRVVETQ